MKKSIIILFLFCSLMAHATHEYAGQITLNYLTSNSYEVKIKLWTDSIGINPNAITYYSSTSLIPNSHSATLSSSSNIGNGILENIYLDTLSNSTVLGTLKVFYTACCRGNLDNVLNSSSASIYFETSLNISPSQINSSPDFLNAPQFFEGIADTLNHNPLAADPDGDSLVYSLVTPLGSGGNALQMTTNPYPSVGSANITINSAVGNIFWVPSTGGSYSYAVRVDEYRNGIAIGHSIRDARVIICLSCKTTMASDFFFDQSAWVMNNNYPTWDVYETIPFTYTFVGGVSGTNANVLDLSIISQADILSVAPSATSTQSGTSVSSQFSWTPALGYASESPFVGVLLGTETNTSNGVSTREQTIILNVSQVPNALRDIEMENFKLYPNPAKGNIIIKTNELNQHCDISILSMDGKVVREASIKKGINIIEIDLSDLTNGFYIVQLKGDNININKKLQLTQ